MYQDTSTTQGQVLRGEPLDGLVMIEEYIDMEKYIGRWGMDILGRESAPSPGATWEVT